MPQRRSRRAVSRAISEFKDKGSQHFLEVPGYGVMIFRAEINYDDPKGRLMSTAMSLLTDDELTGRVDLSFPEHDRFRESLKPKAAHILVPDISAVESVCYTKPDADDT